jgi:hypothetical protein
VNDFLNRTQKAQHLRETMNKWGTAPKVRDSAEQKKSPLDLRQTTEWKKLFASYSSDKGLISRIYRELK